MLTDKQRSDFEARLRTAFATATAGLADELLQLLGTPPNVANVPAEFWAGLAPELANEIGPILMELAVKSALALGESAGIISSANWALVNARASAWATKYSFELVKGINVTTQTRLQTLVDGFIHGDAKNLDALGSEIGKLFGPVRGDMIAITEVTRANAQGEQALVNEIRRLNPNAPIVQIWLTANDEIVMRCPICWPRHGKKRGDGWTEIPPAHVRCRCVIATQIALPELANG